VVDHWGWAGASALATFLLAGTYASLARWLVREGTTPLTAGGVTMLAVGIGSIHFLVRPHLFTYVFVFWTLRACRDYHLRKDWRIWTIPPVVALWANLHGGFLAGPLTVAAAGLGEAISGAWDADRKRKLVVFGAVGALSSLAALINPYGVGLYRHVFDLLLHSGVTELIGEYRSAPFGSGEAQILEWVVLGLIALPVFSRNQVSRYDLVPALVWLHLALGSIRHAPFFAMAVAPMLARLVDGVMRPETERALASRSERWSAWVPLASVGLLLAMVLNLPLGGPDPQHWPLKAVRELNRLDPAIRLFHEQDWGGLIEAECRPKRRTFLDDRFELWGKQPILDYVQALEGGPAWDEIQQREQIGLVWIKPDRPLARRLRKESAWKVVYRDRLSILFERNPRAQSAESLAANGD
ncbi:MAG TPA: hypothetical protein VFT74_19695, partial [Isosphaeraceae bacterium]|nr:hypothetical protein [Isosphaeraceae bacterium]